MTKKEFKELKIGDHIILINDKKINFIGSVFKIINVLYDTIYYLNVYSKVDHSKTAEYCLSIYNSESLESFKIMNEEEINDLYKRIIFG